MTQQKTTITIKEAIKQLNDIVNTLQRYHISSAATLAARLQRDEDNNALLQQLSTTWQHNVTKCQQATAQSNMIDHADSNQADHAGNNSAAPSLAQSAVTKESNVDNNSSAATDSADKLASVTDDTEAVLNDNFKNFDSDLNGIFKRPGHKDHK